MTDFIDSKKVLQKKTSLFGKIRYLFDKISSRETLIGNDDLRVQLHNLCKIISFKNVLIFGCSGL